MRKSIVDDASEQTRAAETTMLRELRITLSIMAVVLIAAAPLIFAAPAAAPTNYTYLAMALHVVPIPPTVHVRSYRMIPSPSASAHALYVAGEIENGTNQPVFSTRVIATFSDGSGVPLATQSTFAALPRTDPGQRNPFRMLLLNPHVGINTVAFNVTFSGSTGPTYVPATVVSHHVRDAAGVEVVGEVRNDQANAIQDILVAATFYDSVGGVFDVAWNNADIAPLAPGTRSTYTISTFNTSLSGLSYTMQAQGAFAP
jgi:hypothetical protein